MRENHRASSIPSPNATVFIVLIWVACAAVGSAITAGKGRGRLTGVLLGGLLGLIGLIICACLSKTTEQRARELAEIQSMLGRRDDR